MRVESVERRWELIFFTIADSLMKLFARLDGEPQTASTRLGIVCGYRRIEIETVRVCSCT